MHLKSLNIKFSIIQIIIYITHCKQAMACANGTNSSLCNRFATLHSKSFDTNEIYVGIVALKLYRFNK